MTERKSCFNCKKAWLREVEQLGCVTECSHFFEDEEADKAEACEWDEYQLPEICLDWEQR